MTIDAGSIVITGASGGIGSALARELAGPNRRMLLIGRSTGRLEAIAEEARLLGAQVDAEICDVTDSNAISTVVTEFDDKNSIDLLITNAGITTPLKLDQCSESTKAAEEVVNVNLLGVINCVTPLLPRMYERKSGHIAIVSALAAVCPHGDLLSYSASKAGSRAYGDALRKRLRGSGISFSVICTGYVTSPMSARHDGPRPYEMSADAAARRIVRGLASKQNHISFPWQLVLLARLSNMAPSWISDRIERQMAATILPGSDDE